MAGLFRAVIVVVWLGVLIAAMAYLVTPAYFGKSPVAVVMVGATVAFTSYAAVTAFRFLQRL